MKIISDVFDLTLFLLLISTVAVVGYLVLSNSLAELLSWIAQ